jgi:hypothetical protein
MWYFKLGWIHQGQRGWNLVILCHSFGTFCNSTLTLYVKKTCQVQVICV